VDGIKVVEWLNATRELLRNPDLVAEEHLGGVPFPATVATGGYHEPAGIINIELGDCASTVAWDDEEWGG
jgi:hypothetical protein